MEVITITENNIENVENVDETPVFFTTDLEDDIKSLHSHPSHHSLQSLDDTPLAIEEVDEPIDPEDSIVILGYYPLNPYFSSFRNSWGHQLPIANVGRTVFCGVLESDETKKVEVELCLRKPQIDYFSVLDSERTPIPPTATAVMRRVVDYGKDMLYVVKEPFGNAIDPLPSKQVQEYTCRFFSVSDEGWNEGNRAPFLLNDNSFMPCHFF
jgi:hypothetical protein